MPVYSYAQLETLWINAGGSKATAPLAAAIAEAESGGNSDAYNGHDTNGRGGTQVSAGLWQISNGTMTPIPGWASPAVNAQAAVAKWKAAGGFSPWGTYTSGAYRAFLSGKTVPDPNVPGSATQLDAQAAAAGAADCLIGGNHLALFFGMGPSLPCLFTKSNARGFIGVGLMVAGALVILPGLVFVVLGIPQLRAVANGINQIPVAGATTQAVTSRGQAAVQKAPWYRAAGDQPLDRSLFT